MTVCIKTYLPDTGAAVPGTDTGGPYSRGSRDSNNDSMQKRREYTWREEDELRGGSFLNKKKESAWRDQDYDNLYSNPGGRAPTEKGDGKVNQPGENPTRSVFSCCPYCHVSA